LTRSPVFISAGRNRPTYEHGFVGVGAQGQVYEKVFSFTDDRALGLATASGKGGEPLAGLVEGRDGDFYGTTFHGGASNFGTIFKVASDGTLTTLVESSGNGASNNGREPAGALVLGSDGNSYGTTARGGAADLGTVFRMTSVGVLTTLVEFTGQGGSHKGSYPQAGLVRGNDGRFYGTTSRGGASDLGTLFSVTVAGALTTRVEFTGNQLPKGGHAERKESF
jgi:uncharacterized repeat protein (TIGR03803 family)